MRIIKPEVHFKKQDWKELLHSLEEKGRVCYKSEDRMTDTSAAVFIRSLIQRGHTSVLEHGSVSMKFIVDRGVTHEMVRHRHGAYSQESTRYCNYGGNHEITVIEPFFFRGDDLLWESWQYSCAEAETMYQRLLIAGATPDEARSVLPTSLKTELWATYNLRQLRHFLKLRSSKRAHPQMRQVAIPLLIKVKDLLPVIAADIDYDYDFPTENYAEVKLI
jgi:thymidylate synthase (FAD)